MKALLSVEPGGPETLRLSDVPVPQPEPDQIRVRVAASAINYPDVLIIEDKYQFKPERPFAPGGEISGIVENVGRDVRDFAIGDRVVGLCGSGGLADQVVLPNSKVFRLPPGFDLMAAAGLLMTYGTTIHAFVDRGGVKPGETILVLGAAGGIGLSAIEVGRALGARVVAAVSSQAKADVATSAGADRTIIYPTGVLDIDAAKSVAAMFKDAVGSNGADIVYDPVGGGYAEPALRSIAWGGRYLVVGFSAGIPSVPLNLPLLKSCDIRGVFWGSFIEREPVLNRIRIEQLFRMWGEGKIRPRIDKVFSLADGSAAIRRLANREALGKVIVQVAD